MKRAHTVSGVFHFLSIGIGNGAEHQINLHFTTWLAQQPATAKYGSGRSVMEKGIVIFSVHVIAVVTKAFLSSHLSYLRWTYQYSKHKATTTPTSHIPFTFTYLQHRFNKTHLALWRGNGSWGSLVTQHSVVESLSR